jgi:hypothetical protein
LPNSGDGAWQRTRLPHGHVASTTPFFSSQENFVFDSGTTRFISAPANSRRFLSSARLGTTKPAVPRSTSVRGGTARLGRCTCVRPKFTHMFSSPMNRYGSRVPPRPTT